MRGLSEWVWGVVAVRAGLGLHAFKTRRHLHEARQAGQGARRVPQVPPLASCSLTPARFPVPDRHSVPAPVTVSGAAESIVRKCFDGVACAGGHVTFDTCGRALALNPTLEAAKNGLESLERLERTQDADADAHLDGLLLPFLLASSLLPPHAPALSSARVASCLSYGIVVII